MVVVEGEGGRFDEYDVERTCRHGGGGRRVKESPPVAPRSGSPKNTCLLRNDHK